MTRYDAVVVGAGANGLVAAAALARAGRQVLLLERREEVGGQGAPLTLDAGWLPPVVAKGLGLPAIPAVEPPYSVTVAADGGYFALPRDPAQAAAAIRQYSQRDAARWPAFVAQLRNMSGFLEAVYQLPPPDIGTTAMREILPLVGVARRFRSLGRRNMTELLRILPMPVQDLLDDAFESRALKAALGAGGVRDIRQGPRSGGTSFVLLHYLAGAPAGSVRARSWWRSGPGAFDEAVLAVARAAGVTVRTNAPVSNILVKDDAVSGVVLESGEEISARIVVSTADPARTLLGMVDPLWLDPDFLHAVGNIKFRGSTVVVRYEMDRLPGIPGLDGIVSLTPSIDLLERAYDAAKYRSVSERPHVEITSPTLRWPARSHVVVARAQYAPYAATCDVGQLVTATIDSVVPGFADSVRSSQVFAPRDIEREYALTEGAMTHGELTLDQIMFMRPVPGWGRYAMPVTGLYLGGAGAHPGPGILGAAGWLAAKAALKQ